MLARKLRDAESLAGNETIASEARILSGIALVNFGPDRDTPPEVGLRRKDFAHEQPKLRHVNLND